MVGWPSKAPVTVPGRWQYLEGLEPGSLQEAVYAPNQCPTYGVASLTARFHRSRNREWKREWRHSLVPLVTHEQHFCFLFPWPHVLLAYRSELQRQELLKETQQWLDWTRNEDCSPATPGSSCLWINRQRRKLLCWLEWLILTSKGKLDYTSTMEVRKNMSGVKENLIKVGGKLQPNPAGVTSGPDSPEMKV